MSRSGCSDVRLGWLLIAALVLVLIPGLSSADPDDRPIVVLRVDDCPRTWMVPFGGLGGQTGYSYCKARQIPVTWAVITDNTTAGTYLTWQELIDYLNAAGGEVASHSCKHIEMPTTQAYIDELINSKAAIESHIPGYTCKTFIQPGSWTNDAELDSAAKLNNSIGMTIQANYQQSAGYIASGWHVGDNIYKYGISWDYSIDYAPGSSVDAALQTLDVVAHTPGLVYKLTCHGVQEEGGTEYYKSPANVLKAVIDRLVELRDAGAIRLMTLNDAFHTTFSPGLNRVPDPGFEYCNPGPNNPRGPIDMSSGCSISPTGGRNDSRCLVIQGSNKMNNVFRLDPGRYCLTWWQSISSQQPYNSVLARVMLSSNGGQNQCTPMPNTFFSNQQPNTWEEKKTYFVVPQGYMKADTSLTFAGSGSVVCKIDDISIVSAPVDPAVSPSNFAATPKLTQCVLAWDTPNDPDVTSIVIRSGTNAHPMTPTSGSSIANVTAVPGTRQQTTVNMSWSQSVYYMSVFARKANGDFSPPDLLLLVTDATPPTAPKISLACQSPTVYTANWTSEDPESGIYDYKYAVGTTPYSDNIIRWTTTSDPSALLTGLPEHAALYISVISENSFGKSSNTTTMMMRPPTRIGDALGTPDGQKVTVDGVISAIFRDYYYIQSSQRTSGIRVNGRTDAHEGDTVTVTGTMDSVDDQMERVIIPDPPLDLRGR